MTVRTFNPAFLSDEDTVASYCVRTAEFESVVEMLRADAGTASPHQIVIGPRGSGKTTLLLRVAAELRREPRLCARYSPIVFAEESYGVATAGEFWLECVSRLQQVAEPGPDVPDVAATYEELRRVLDDRMLAERCLATILDFADRLGRRLVLVVENLNTLLGELRDPDAGWQLRKVMQTEPRILLLASATQRFAEIDDPEKPLYDLFRLLSLRPLDTVSCARLWQSLTGREARPGVVRALQILTGGNPRLFVIVARLGQTRSFHRLLDDLMALIDDHTEYFRSHLEALPAQERRVYLALADLWKPATASEIAEHARLSASQCSAQLARLMARGGVETAGGTDRRRQYYVTERLYNIYHLLRRAGGPDPLVEALVRFMESFYSTGELRTVGLRMPFEASALDGPQRRLHDATFARLLALPALAPHRSELTEAARSAGLAVPSDEKTHTGTTIEAVEHLFDHAETLLRAGRAEEVLPILDDAQRQHEPDGAVPDAKAVALIRLMRAAVLSDMDQPKKALAACDQLLDYIGTRDDVATDVAAGAEAQRAEILFALGRADEAVAANEQVTRRYGGEPRTGVASAVARAQSNRAVVIGLSDPAAGVAASEAMLNRYGAEENPAFRPFVARALANKGELLRSLGRLDESVGAYDEIVSRYAESGDANIRPVVAMAELNRAVVAGERGNAEGALRGLDEVERRYRSDDAPELRTTAALAAVNRGFAFLQMNRPDDALTAIDDAHRRYGDTAHPPVVEALGNAFVAKGKAAFALGRIDEAIEAFAEAERLVDASTNHSLAIIGARAANGRANALAAAGRHAEAVGVHAEAVDRCADDAEPEFAEIAAMSLLGTGVSLLELGRPTEAVEAYDRALERCEGSAAIRADEIAGTALLNKGSALWEMDRPEGALRAWEGVVQRFGASTAGNLPLLVADAWYAKGVLLRDDGRGEAALEALGEAIRGITGRADPESRALFAEAHLTRLALLGAMGRHAELLAAANELKRLPGAGDAWRDRLIGRASIPVAQSRLAVGNNEAALRAVAEAEGLLAEVSTEDRFRIGWVRAFALLGLGDRGRSEEETRALLSALAAQRLLPSECVARLIDLTAGLGVREMRDLIVASPAAELLRPLTVALEYELGATPRVAVEVAEVAADIQSRLRSRLADEPPSRTTGTSRRL